MYLKLNGVQFSLKEIGGQEDTISRILRTITQKHRINEEETREYLKSKETATESSF